MKYLENDIAFFHYTEPLLPYIIKLCTLIKKNPFILDHFNRISDEVKKIFKEEGFLWYSTVKKTTLFYNHESEYFFKILHPLNLKNRISYYFFDKAKNIYTTTEYLIAKGIKVTRVWAYGNFRQGYNNPFFVIKKVEGESLYDILIRKQKTLPREAYFEVIKEISKIHNLGYWLGDAHLSHIFIKDNRVSGIIDVDSIKKNIPFRYQNLAKDLAGLNHPKLPMTKDDRMSLLNYYLEISDIRKPKKFLKLLKHYTDRRWKA